MVGEGVSCAIAVNAAIPPPFKIVPGVAVMMGSR
jgi:hypothetical protein